MPGIPEARVVAVIAETASGSLAAFGTGFLLDATRVLTARHCVIDRGTGQPAASLRVQRASDGADVAVVVGAMTGEDLDVALLVALVPPPWGADLPGGPVRFGKLEREYSGQLDGCEAVGFPLWQQDEARAYRDVAEVHGPVRALEGKKKQRLVLRDPVLTGVSAGGGRAWAGFSGAAVFHGDLLLGVVIEHYAWKGDTSLEIRPLEAVARAGDAAARRLADALGISGGAGLQVLEGRGRWRAEDAGETALAQWGWSLERDREGVRHWRPRARGVSTDSEQGWRFRGRAAALSQIVAWLDRPCPDRKVLVVTGSPGAGKSAVLGRIVTTADASARAALPREDGNIKATEGSVHCAVHAKGKTALEIAAEIARAASAMPPEQLEDFAPALRDALSRRDSPFNVIIDALDEAASPSEARTVIGKLVVPVIETCADVGAQVIVGSRRDDANGDLLGTAGAAVTQLIDLDDAEFFREGDLKDYAMATLQLIGAERRGNPYADDAVAGPVAARIAALSEGNFLVAGLTARTHGLYDETAADPSELSFTAKVDEAMGEYLRRIPPPAGGLPAETLLTALSFAESPGLPLVLWRTALRALGAGDIPEFALDQFARSAAASFLVESSGDRGQGTTFQLFHQALNEALLRSRAENARRSDDEQALTLAFTAYGRMGQWRNSPAYLLGSLPAHAARAGVVDGLLADDAYLLHADLRRVRQAASQATSTAGRQRARLLRLSPDEVMPADPLVRIAMFSVTEALESAGNSYQRSTEKTPYRAVWATARRSQEHLILRGHHGAVNAVCSFTAVDGAPRLATASKDATIRIWNPETGSHTRILNGGSKSIVTAMCSFTAADGVPLLVTASGGNIRIWDPESHTEIRTLDDHSSGVQSMCSYIAAYGRPFLVTASDDETARIWDPESGTEIRTLNGRHHWIRSVCAYATTGGVARLVTTSHDGIVRIWDPESGTEIRTLNGHNGDVNALCAYTTPDGTPRLAATYNDGIICIWDPESSTEIRTFNDHWMGSKSVCSFTALDGGPRLATTAPRDKNVHIWDPESGTEIRTLNGHNGNVNAFCAYTASDGTPRLVTASEDGTARIWDPDTNAQIRARNTDPGWVRSISPYTTTDGSPRVATIFGIANSLAFSGGGPVGILDPEAGTEIRTLSTGNDDYTAVCAYTAADGSPRLAIGSRDRAVRIWDPEADTEIRTLYWCPLQSICSYTTFDGAPRLAIASEDETIHIWDPEAGTELRTLNKRSSWSKSRSGTVCAYTATDGTPRLAIEFGRQAARIWDPEIGNGTEIRSLHSRDSWGQLVPGGSYTTLDGAPRLAIISGRVVSIWDPEAGIEIHALNGHNDHVNAVCTYTAADGTPRLVTGSKDRTVRVWDVEHGKGLLTIPVRDEVSSVAWSGELLVVGTMTALLAIRLRLE